MRVVVTGKRGHVASALSKRAAPGVEPVALAWHEFDDEDATEAVGAAAQRPANSRLGTTKFTPAYGFSFRQWTESLPACVERWIERTPRGDPPSVGPSPSELQTAD